MIDDEALASPENEHEHQSEREEERALEPAPG